MSQNIDREKIKEAIAIILWSGWGAYHFQPLIHGNQDAINVIVTMFSILAGFLVAVITLIGDPKSLPSGSWQKARLGSELTYNRLTRHKWLFKTYLATLALIFVSMLMKKKLQDFQCYVEYGYLFLAISAFVMSFRLPASLMHIQRERIEAEIKERREQEGISE
ncbi:Uncharacterised protein [BD1-7 clade bacterium]|uniref:Uncharacterized protein n=1 Tax=BD1-7 clade bacterium TaxID=2029982 RepID=A0A5S9Q470_9GAMM|nr:Uncharacterised protein [BD1-7 clade bacterium]CAA0111701.1 Uncharacterised protein [BD1-7 clade bacterium]